MVDFPVLVYPTRAATGRPERFLDFDLVSRDRVASLSSRSILDIRSRMRLRSVSSFVSPGPRVPMPAPSRESSTPLPRNRGSRYRYCANSTWRRPSCLLYTSDAADDLLCVDLGGRRIIKKKK